MAPRKTREFRNLLLDVDLAFIISNITTDSTILLLRRPASKHYWQQPPEIRIVSFGISIYCWHRTCFFEHTINDLLQLSPLQCPFNIVHLIEGFADFPLKLLDDALSSIRGVSV